MYAAIYVCRMPADRVEAFLRVQQTAAAIYREHGAVETATYVAADLQPRYGCAGFDPGTSGDVVLLGIDGFRSRDEYDAVMANIDTDERIDRLYAEVTELIDVGTIVRGEFARADDRPGWGADDLPDRGSEG